MAQGSNQARDRARYPLFSYVDEDKLRSIETYARKYSKFISKPIFSIQRDIFYPSCLGIKVSSIWSTDFVNLLDNYEMSTGVTETVTSQEMMENHLFLDAILQTEVMKVRRTSLFHIQEHCINAIK